MGGFLGPAATDKAIALTPWSDVPKGLKLLSTQRTDAKGAFDFELPQLNEGQVVELVATKGGQTFTALFNSRGRYPRVSTYMAVKFTILDARW